MATLRQIEANRNNALLSTGPKTPEGKAAVRFNALKTGIHAAERIIPGEDPQDFEYFARQLNGACHPADPREQILVDTMISHAWRLRRLLKAEPQIWERIILYLQGDSAADPNYQLADALNHKPDILLRAQHLIAGIQRGYRQAAADLDHLQTARANVSATPSKAQHIKQTKPLNCENGFVPAISATWLPTLPQAPSRTTANVSLGPVTVLHGSRP